MSPDAIKGDNNLEIAYSFTGGNGEKVFLQKFPINVEDSRSDFEVSVKDYDPINKQITFDILNTDENNVEALTVDIPKQDRVNLRGSNRVVVGSLDANEEDTFVYDGDFKGGDINLTLTYTDQIAKRRVLEKTVHFDPSYFDYKLDVKGTTSPTLMFILGFLIPVLFFWARHKYKKHKEKKKRELMRK